MSAALATRPQIDISDLKLSKVLMSNRQFAVLRMFTENPNLVVDLDTAMSVDQRSFGSMFHRTYIRFDRGKKGFVITSLGRQAKMMFEATNDFKDHPSAAFSHYIRTIKTLADYHVVPHGRAA